MSKDFRSSHFSLKHRMIARLSRLLDGMVYTQRRGLIRGMKRRGGLGFVPQFIGSGESPELGFFRELDLEGLVIYDIGAFQGVMTLFFSRKAKHVVTYEPNPSSHARVKENLQLNGIENVTLRHVAVGDAAREATLTVDPLMPGAASAEPTISEHIKAGGGDADTENVRVVRLDDDIREHGLPDPDFVKIDIEGYELNALRGMTATMERARPRLYLEMHGADEEEKRRKVHAIVEFLAGAGYRDIRHIESGTKITPDNSALAAQGHLLCRPTG